eukprot:CAMPEP_0185597858 /NCGR_PEP_ID=MMETSP0434-20130131/81630_1 /TAXON_ID=626734 ORGANISM="Favella taraikaensis, Strain Fe Narragansett Bay" /NCGR_SAMPLE_ID=MMETSP0434 /ASSEMBLY_ACC=CAM_ASM_000379 /LENGTH=94 /DNA_ID=CAMNT_0028226687 /DNA_START=1836 /DNA_END=2120 /DNA_ORIENTATION=+
MALFLLRKEVRLMRFEFIMRFLHLTQPAQLEKYDYVQDRMQIFMFKSKSFRPAEPVILSFWDEIRDCLYPHVDELFDNGNANSINVERAVELLT